MGKHEPLISVLICNYNYAKYIKETLNSATAQTYQNIEIIVIDDGSTDESVPVVNKCINENPKSNIRFIPNKKNKGICYTRNEALAAAEGDYVLFLDSDDTIPIDYIETMYTLAIKHSADVVYGDMKLFGDQKGVVTFPEYSLDELLLHNYINVSSLLRKDKLDGQKFDTKLNRQTLEDYDFWLGLALKGLKFIKAPNVYLNYRIQSKTRNKNVLSIREKALSFIDKWSYSIEKYRKLYPKMITGEVYLDEIRYQLNQMQLIEDEVKRLNNLIQNELNPELRVRDKHINHQKQQIEDLQSRLEKLLASNDYRLGRMVFGPVRKIKRHSNNQ